MLFKNREVAAILLSKKLQQYKNSDTVVLAVPRGGVPIGNVLASELNLPLDFILAKKIGHPINSEYAIGCVTMDDVFISNHSNGTTEYYQNESKKIKKDLKEKYKNFMNGRQPVSINEKNVIITDDGIATGETLKACIESVRKKNPKKIILAVPVAPKSTANLFRNIADEFICLFEPKNFRGVGQFYSDFSQVNDFEVKEILSNQFHS